MVKDIYFARRGIGVRLPGVMETRPLSIDSMVA